MTVRIGVVGCGWAGRQAALAASLVPDTELVAVADMDPDRRHSVADEFDVPAAVETHNELLSIEDVEAVYVATPPDVRLPIVFDVASAGRHVLVQKPHAVRAGEIREMESAATEQDVTLMFSYFMRHRPIHRRLRAAVTHGIIGEPYHARIFVHFNAIPPLTEGTRWLHEYGYNGGALGQHASHELDLAWWLMGCQRPNWAFATRHSPYAVDGVEEPAEDYLSGHIGFANGSTIQIDCSRMLHVDAASIVDVYGTTGAISGTEITRYDRDAETYIPVDISSTIEADIDHTHPPERPDDDPAHFYYEVEHFAMAVNDDVPPDVSADDAYRYMTILNGLSDSARRGEIVTIDA